MVKKVFKSVKASKPTISESANSSHKQKQINYNKMTTKEQMEYDLKQIKRNERNLKNAIRAKGYSFKTINKYITKILGRYDPNVVHIKNLVYNGKDIISIRINANKYKNIHFKVKDVKDITNKFSQYLLKKEVSGKLMTSMKYGDLNWKSGNFRNIGEEARLYNPNELYNLEVPFDEPQSIESFNMYLALGSKPQGGIDNGLNDCLYNCLKYFVFNIEEYYKSPAEFKKSLGLKRADKVPLSCIDKIEKKLKNYQINVRGEHIRSSTISSTKQINIILTNEHYEVEKLDRKFILFPKYDEKTPIMFNKKTFEAYDGNKKWSMTREERNSILYNFKSPYILIETEYQGRDEKGEVIKISIEDEFKEWVENTEALKVESKGMINLFKTGSYHDTALSLFDRITKFINPEPLLQDEAEWINLSSFSALIKAEVYSGELYKYDVKSLYPYLMNSTTLKFPVKRGEFKQITEFNNDFIYNFEYGIYRCIVSESEDENINKLFGFNVDNYYTSIDLTNAKKLNLSIKLIIDSKPNFLHWSRDKLITFNEVFKNYIDILFPLKENKVQKAKNILNMLWGALGEINKRKQYVSKEFSLEEEEEIIEMYPSLDETAHVIKTTKRNNYYKTSFARLCPFLLAQGRKHMSDLMFGHRANIKRIQTDGFYTTEKIHTNRTVNLGELKYEGYTPNGNILNKTNYVHVE